MAKQSIELALGTKFDGSGFEKLDRAVRNSGQITRECASSVRQVSASLGEMGGSVGKAAGAVGKLGGILSAGSPLMIGIAAVTAAFTWTIQIIKKFKDAADDAKLAAKGLSKEFMTLEAAQRGYQKRVEGYRKAKQEADEAERKAAQAELARTKALQKAERERLEGIKDLAEWKMKMANAEALHAAKTPEERAAAEVANAQRGLDFAMEFGGLKAQKEAEQALRFAKDNQQDAANKSFEDFLKAQQTRLDDMEKEHQGVLESLKRKALERRKEKEKLAAEEKLAEIDKKLTAAKEEAARMEEIAARARGKSFNEWDRGEKKLAKDKEREQKKQAGNIERAQKEMDAIGGRIFDRNGKLRKGANAAEVERWKKLNEFLVNQDPNNNPALKAAQKLEQEKKELAKKTKETLDDIAKQLKKATT